ncbi:helix-turn-helix domain-containing protein [Oryzibacter oryziterrae]|uniref:helix-turn-helix domain-containing protein n=1 Tax=Oryzibacter oryziterrae TaxID=2766474 RepID=UPI001F22E346|nr:AraC family transcriptional regulator [Oryzibacter oryziterrae]
MQAASASDRYRIVEGDGPEMISEKLNDAFRARITSTNLSEMQHSVMNGFMTKIGGVFWQEGFSGIEIETRTRYHMQVFTLEGAMSVHAEGQLIEGGQNDLVQISPNILIRKRFAQGSRHVYLALPDDCVRDRALFLFSDRGYSFVGAPVSVSHLTPLNKISKRIILNIIDYLDDASTDRHDSFVMESLEYLRTLYVRSHYIEHEGGMLDGDACAGDVSIRIAIEHIKENWRQSLSLQDLVQLTGVSPSTLLRAFKRHTGMTPMAFLKQTRLRRARDLLLAADRHVTITEVIFSCGFGNTGHFAREYKELFGELPSETLRRRVPDCF